MPELPHSAGVHATYLDKPAVLSRPMSRYGLEGEHTANAEHCGFDYGELADKGSRPASGSSVGFQV